MGPPNKKAPRKALVFVFCGGGCEIRTHGGVTPSAVFKSPDIYKIFKYLRRNHFRNLCIFSAFGANKHAGQRQGCGEDFTRLMTA